MKHIIRLGAILAAALFATAAVASSALAAEVPENLPFSASTRTFTGKNTVAKPKWNSEADNFTCESVTGEGTEAPGKAGVAPSGEFHIHFVKCKEEAFGQSCNSKGDSSGIILMLGTWKLVWDRKNGGSFELTVATVFSVTAEFECTALAKIKVTGTQVCLDLKTTESNTTHEYHCEPVAPNSPKQSEEYCEKDKAGACTWIKPTFAESLNGAAAKPAAWEMLGNDVFGEAIAADAL